MKNTARRFAAVSFACLGWAVARGDPLDEAYGRTFYITTIGVRDSQMAGYRSNLLSLAAGNAMPPNLKIGFSVSAWYLRFTQGALYDYVYDWYGSGISETDMRAAVTNACANGLVIGFHINGMPWGDEGDQDRICAANFLEKWGGGALLQKDRNGHIRWSGVGQEPATDETNASPEFLEMQLTLSRNCGVVQDYAGRNARMAARMIEWWREQHPDTVVFASMSSEYAQNYHANGEWCDYSDWSKGEFRAWLGGTGLYAGQGQYATLADFNAAFTNATGFPVASFASVNPPVTPNWNAKTADGKWWLKWHDFRVAQVRGIEQAQVNWTREAGVPPDRIFGHQIPFDPSTANDTERKFASPWTTTFCEGGGNGITTYGANAANSTIFNAMYADDKNWGVFEYNRLSTSIADNLNAMSAVWNSKGHILTPYQWGSTDAFNLAYHIEGSAFETALQRFITNHQNHVYAGYAPHEGSPTSRDVVWAMNEAGDAEEFSGATNAICSAGELSASATGDDPYLSLEVDEGRHSLTTDGYFSASFRMVADTVSTQGGRIAWSEQGGGQGGVSFATRPGTNVYRVNLGGNAGWREKRVTRIELHPGVSSGGVFRVDWFRLEANHCWHFDGTNEIFEPSGFTSNVVAGGQFTGTASGSASFYLATDKCGGSAHADRAVVNAAIHKLLRVRMDASEAGSARFRWWTRSTGPHVATFPVQPGARTYEIDLSGEVAWDGEVTRLQLEPLSAGGSVSVDYLTLSPLMCAPRAALNEIILNTSRPVFQWDAAIEPEHAGLTHDLEIATDFGFTNTVVASYGIAGERWVYPGTPELSGFHWWRVRSVDAHGAVSPWMTPMPVFVRRWTGDSAEEIWSQVQSTAPVTSNGVLSATSTGIDPYYHLNCGYAGTQRRSAGFRADIYPRFRARARVSAPTTNNTLQVFSMKDATNLLFSRRDVAFPADGQWREFEVDFAGAANFTGYQKYARIDPCSQSNAVFELDYAELLPAATAANSAPVITPIAAQTTAVNTVSAPIAFQVVDLETPASMLSLAVSSSDTSLVAEGDIVITGIGANRTVVFAPRADRAGEAMLTLTADDGEARTIRSFPVLVTGSAIENWRQQYFGSTANTGDGADGADPEHDGLPNLMEYALGSHPRAPSPTAVPRVSIYEEGGLRYLMLSIDRNPDASGVSFTVEVSGDLVHWDSGPPHTVVIEDTSTRLRVRDSTPLPPGVRRFIRLRMTTG